MKFYPDKIYRLINDIVNLRINALLLYGPDKGYIDKICNTIIQKFNAIPSTILDSHLHASQFETLLNTKNFFGQRECIKLFISASQFNTQYKSVLRNNNINFPIFIIDELSAQTEIRKFFESEPYLASVGCYYSDAQRVTRLVLSKLAAAGKTIEHTALEYCAIHLQTNYQLINNEIDKLIYYAHDKSVIELVDVNKIISSAVAVNGDSLCVYFINKELAQLDEELTKLLQQNISMVLIIRALIRYYLNIYTVLLLVKDGVNIDNACKTLSPPIFFKQVDNFKKITNSLTLSAAITAIYVLQQAEMQFKLQNSHFDFYQHIYFKIHHL